MLTLLQPPGLRLGAIILAEKAFAPDHLASVRDPANGYLSRAIPLDEGRSNEFGVKIA